MAATSLIPPEVRARLRELRLVARRGAGDGLGQHASRSRGAGLEFAQYRAYEPGDEPRRIDWKLYARSDRYFVREAERDSPLTAWLLLDATASMRQTDTARPAWAKLDAAKALAACVIELALRQGDRFGLITIGGAAPLAIPAGAGPRQRDRCLLGLAGLAAAGSWPNDATLKPRLERIAPGALVLLVSDFFDEPAVALAERLADARREVLCVQLLGADERDFPFRGGHRFRDPESDAERTVDAGAVRADFLARFAAARAELAGRFAARGIRHSGYVLDEPLDAPLRRLFGANATAKMGRVGRSAEGASPTAVAPVPDSVGGAGRAVAGGGTRRDAASFHPTLRAAASHPTRDTPAFHPTLHAAASHPTRDAADRNATDASPRDRAGEEA